MKEHLYSKRPNLVIGFHGCDKSVLEKVINGQDNLQKSENIYDWFFEGKQLYSGAGFSEKDHIQLCIKNPNCIKGFFLPREIDDRYPNP